MKKLLLVLVLVILPYSVQAQQDTTDGNWTEMTFTIHDRIDGVWGPRLSGGLVNFIGGKGIGAFLGDENAVGPLTMWRVWQRGFGAFKVSIFSVASSDVSQAGEVGLFNNATIGLEPRIWWSEFGNAEIGVGVLNTTFRDGETVEWTPYFKMVFRP
jgi:hypothetical protein